MVTMLQFTQTIQQLKLCWRHPNQVQSMLAGGPKCMAAEYAISKYFTILEKNVNADILSQNPPDRAPDIFQSDEVQIAAIWTTQPATKLDIRSLLGRHHSLTNSASSAPTNEFALSQQQDPELLKIIEFLTNDLLSDNKTDAEKVVAQAHSFAIVDGLLYFIESSETMCCAQIVEEPADGRESHGPYGRTSCWRKALPSLD